MLLIRRLVTQERGQTSAEYIGLIVVIAAGILALGMATGVGGAMKDKMVCAIEAIGGGGCGGAAPTADGGGDEGGGGDDGGGEDEDGGNFFTGAWEGAKDVGGELWGVTKGVGRHVNVFDPGATADQWGRTFDTAGHVITHPWESTKAVASSFWDPISESYAHGGLDEAFGRGLVTGAGAVLGGKGLTKVGRLGRADRADGGDGPDPDSRRQAESANCVSNSFTAATAVLLPSGERRAIARLGVGDRVLATDPETGETGARAVERVIVGEGRKTIVRVRASGAVISATDWHPFWVESRRVWRDADQLRAGDVLRGPDGERRAVESVDVLEPRRERVFNLTVAGLHTYYAGARPVLVHNADCPPEPPSPRALKNGHLAGKTHPKTGVRFKETGYPDFSPYATQTVKVPNLTGRDTDFALANRAAGLPRKPRGYTWHHVEDGETMQLVPTDIHAQTGHSGGAELLRRGVAPSQTGR